MKNIKFEYGHGLKEAMLPDSADVFIPGKTVKDPDYIPEEQIYEETYKSIINPIGMPAIPQLVNKDSKVTIIFPDKVKGGFQDSSHRKTAIPVWHAP